LNSGSQPQENPGSQPIAVKVIKLKCLNMSFYEDFVSISVLSVQIEFLGRIFRF